MYRKHDRYKIEETLRRFNMAMSMYKDLDHLRMSLFAASVKMIDEMSQEERDHMMEHIDTVRVLR